MQARRRRTSEDASGFGGDIVEEICLHCFTSQIEKDIAYFTAEAPHNGIKWKVL